MSSKFQEILDLCKNRGYVFSSDIKKLILGPVGCLLQENLKTEWLKNNLVRRDISMFFSEENFLVKSYQFARDICNERLPFGVVNISEDVSEENKEEITEWNQYFHPVRQTQLQTFMFVAPGISTQYFYKWQQLRRMWWRMLSASPGRYELSDIQICSPTTQSVDITSTFPWGAHVLENIVLMSDAQLLIPRELLQTKDNRKKVEAHCIKSTTHLSTMVMNILCDSYDEPLYQETKRTVVRFHRKVAPYKLSFAISAKNASKTDELNELAVYLCKKLREKNISILFLPLASRNSLESLWVHYDQLGIPYSIILNDNTLKNGLVFLRSRDTTLKEQLHITDLPSHVDLLFKNY